MRNKRLKKDYIILYFVGLIPIVYFALKLSPFIDGGIFNLINNSDQIFNNFFKIELCDKSLKTVLIFVGIYLVALCVFICTERNFRRGEEYGSAKWGNPFKISKRYTDKDNNNKILTQNVSIGLDGKKHKRNVNVMVVGGSGAGKTRYFALPNIMQSNSSLLILDPKGELVSTTGKLLENKGYKVRVLDLIDMNKSSSYNPFVYLNNDNDIQKLVTNIFSNTTPNGTKSQDPFWDQAAMMLLMALVCYLHYNAPTEEQNFSMVMEMIRYGEVREDNDCFKSSLDMLFEELKENDPDHIALKYYKNYRSGAAKTLKSIQITLISRLEKFNLSSLAAMTMDDEMELNNIGKEKTAIFAVIPDNDSSFNFIIGMLYTQLFQQLYYQADFEYNGSLPVHVHFIMDEFANVSLPNEFDKILSTMRSRNISVSIILQNISQLKKLFEKEWESIIGNCDEFLYLGGNEKSTHEYVSSLLGKETIDMNTYGQSKGTSGSYSTNWQILGRDLLYLLGMSLVAKK